MGKAEIDKDNAFISNGIKVIFTSSVYLDFKKALNFNSSVTSTSSTNVKWGIVATESAIWLAIILRTPTIASLRSSIALVKDNKGAFKSGLRYSKTSSLRIRPLLPEPEIKLRSRSCSRANLRTAGVVNTLLLISLCVTFVGCLTSSNLCSWVSISWFGSSTSSPSISMAYKGEWTLAVSPAI